MQESHELRPIALVLGFNIHGLAVARALAMSGIEVHALSPYPNMPANKTRHAYVHIRGGADTGDVSKFLHEFAKSHLRERTAIIFPTNDKIVESIGANWAELPSNYRLSWSNASGQVLELLSKDNLPNYCKRAGIPYPKSATAFSIDECLSKIGKISKTLIVKPAKPLSSFKAEIVHSKDALASLYRKHPNDTPFVVQEYIEGDGDSLYFCSMYLTDGKEVASFTGKKLRAVPLNTGQGTVMTTEANEAVLELSRKFVANLHLSGPVSIEYRRDAQGRYWMIEPNVGRTEYCIDLAVQAGLNFPLLEYQDVTDNQDLDLPTNISRETTWYDTEKDPLCFLRHCLETRSIRPMGKQCVFPYAGHNDAATFAAALIWPIRKRIIRLRRTLLQAWNIK